MVDKVEHCFSPDYIDFECVGKDSESTIHRNQVEKKRFRVLTLF